MKATKNSAYQNSSSGKKRSFPNAGSSEGGKGWKQHKGQGKHAVNMEPNNKYQKGNSKGKSKGKYRHKKW